MVDKITTIPRSKLGTRNGQLGAEDIARLNRLLAIFLGVAHSLAEARR